MITVKINDQDVQFVLDSGAFYSMLSSASAAQLKLRLTPAPFGMIVRGIKGDADVQVATVKTLTLTGVPIHNVEFLVGGSEVGMGGVGLLGQNLLRIGDVEYDLANGAVRLMHVDGCGHTLLAYWAGDKPYSVIDIDSATPLSPHTTGSAFINGAKIRVMFDTGAATSLLSLRAAERAGIKPTTAGVVESGYSTGIGRASVKTYIGPFASFKIGEEEIRNTHLRFGDISVPDADMLIGADFFLSHRIYVASSQRQLYFTYNGGPVFNLTSTLPKAPAATPGPAGSEPAAASAPVATPGAVESPEPAAASAPPATPGPAAAASPAATPGPAGSSNPAPTSTQAVTAAAAASGSAAASSQPAMSAAEPRDAAAYSRRGTAFAARRDFAHALADLTHACELAPGEADYFYQRAVVYRETAQSAKAMSDFDRAIELKSDHLAALTARAALRLNGDDHDGALSDLDTADRIAPKEADVRFFLAEAYGHADRLPQSIAQYDLWIRYHREDPRLLRALNSRCWDRALLGQDLALALTDCTKAYNLSATGSPESSRILNSRGLVRLRLGDYDKSIADFSESLKLNPKNAWSLYGRGIAEVRQKKNAQGEADMAAATALWAKVGDAFTRRGINP